MLGSALATDAGALVQKLGNSPSDQRISGIGVFQFPATPGMRYECQNLRINPDPPDPRTPTRRFQAQSTAAPSTMCPLGPLLTTGPKRYRTLRRRSGYSSAASVTSLMSYSVRSIPSTGRSHDRCKQRRSPACRFICAFPRLGRPSNTSPFPPSTGRAKSGAPHMAMSLSRPSWIRSSSSGERAPACAVGSPWKAVSTSDSVFPVASAVGLGRALR